MPPTSNIYTAPTYSIHREGITAADANVSGFVKKHGCNAASYKYAHIQVIPTSTADPEVTVWWWSDQANSYIQEHTAITKAGAGAATPYEFTINTMGRIFFVQVSALAGAGTVNIMVSGFERIQLS